MSDKLSPNDAKWVAEARKQFIERVDGKPKTADPAILRKLERRPVKPKVGGAGSPK